MVVLILLCGCVREPVAQSVTLTFGAVGSVDAVPLIVAEKNGMFSQQKVQVEIELFKSAQDRDAALQAGRLDGLICDIIAVALYRNAGIDISITGITDGRFSLVAGAGTGITELSQAVGRTVAISQNTIIEYTLDRMLSKAGVDCVEKVIVPPMPTRLEMLSGGKVDLALLPDPFCDAAVLAGGTVIDTLSSDGEGFASVSVFKQEAIAQKGEAIKAFYRVYNEACTYINQTPISELEELIMTFVGYPEPMRGMITLPVFRQNALPPEHEIQDVLDWVYTKQLIASPMKASEVCSDAAG